MSEVRLFRHDAQAFSPGAAIRIGHTKLAAQLRRNWVFVLGCGLAFAAIAYAGTKALAPARYTASGTVATGGTLTLSRAEQELASPALIRGIARDLGLDRESAFNGISAAPADIVGRLHDLLREAGLRLGFGAKPGPGRVSTDDLAVAAVARHLAVRREKNGTITVSFTAPSPQQAAAVINALMSRYVESKRRADQASIREADGRIAQRIRAVSDQVSALEQNIAAARRRFLALQAVPTKAGTPKQDQLSAALAHVSTERAALEAQYARENQFAIAGQLPPDNDEIWNTPALATLRAQEEQTERRLAELSRVHAKNAAVKVAQAELANERSMVATEFNRAMATFGAQLLAARQREEALQSQLAAQQSTAREREAVRSQLKQLESEADAERAIYRSLVEAEQTETAQRQAMQPAPRILRLAAAPASPSSLQPIHMTAFGLLAGFAFGGGIVLLRRKRERYADAAEIADEIGFEVLGAIPKTRSTGIGVAESVVRDPSGRVAEAFRAMRTRLQSASRRPVPRTLLFAASVPGDGASSLAAAFARTAALDRLRVLLIECDLSKPSLAPLLNVMPSSGTVEALAGKEPWRELVRHDGESGVDYLLANPPNGLDHLTDEAKPDPGRLLESMQFKNLIGEARESYNLIVLDSPAVSTARDALILAHAADAVLLVAKAKVTRRDHVRRAVAALAGVARHPPAIVLNAV
jgi:succinoglycan biosynthesis transport protein ExoP